PAAEGSRLPVITHLHAIIGDDQSVSENLSTFSAFVKQIREVLDQAGECSLVLLDELGAGTDPDEGAALAQAILEELAEAGALVIERARTDAAVQLAKARETAKEAEGKAKTIVERAKAEAAALLTDVRRAVSAEWDRLKHAERSRRTLEESRQRLRETAARVEAVAQAAAPHAGEPARLTPGQTVAAEHLGIRGELLAIAGSTATVQSGSLTVRVPLEALRPAGGDGVSGRGEGAPSVRVSF